MARHSGEYVDTLRSPRWRALRAHVIEQQDGLCEDCGEMAELELHHLHYGSLGAETQNDVVALCRDCHPIADKRRQLLSAAFRH